MLAAMSYPVPDGTIAIADSLDLTASVISHGLPTTQPSPTTLWWAVLIICNFPVFGSGS